MARYYFDFFDTEEASFPDSEGTDLPSFDAARDEAVHALMGLARDIRPNGPYRKLQFKVRDSEGRELWQVSLQFEVQPL